MFLRLKIYHISFFMLLAYWVSAQEFEGTIALRATYDQEIKSKAILTIKGNKSLLTVEKDSNETITIFKDYGAGTSVMMRDKNDLRYGFRSYNLHEVDHDEAELIQPSGITVVKTSDHKKIGSEECIKIILKNNSVIAEAWVSPGRNFSLSTYFPEFLVSGADDDMLELRKASDKEGFVSGYWEKHLTSGQENNFEIALEEKEISIDTFHIPDTYLILDEAGIKRLYGDSQRDDLKKKQWDEFQLLFGK